VNGTDSQATTMLIAASWDNTVSAYQVDTAVGADQRTQVTAMTPKLQIKHDAPALSCVVDGTTVYSGGCDRNVKLWDVTKGATATTIGQHDAPVRHVRIVPGMNVVASGGWDNAVKVWDPRQAPGTAAAQAKLTERVFAMDCSANMLVAGTADRGIHVFDLRSGLTNKLATYESPCKVTGHRRPSGLEDEFLAYMCHTVTSSSYRDTPVPWLRRHRSNGPDLLIIPNPTLPTSALSPQYQTRCVSIFADGMGFALGCIEGRVALEYFADMNKPKDAQGQPNKVSSCCVAVLARCCRGHH